MNCLDMVVSLSNQKCRFPWPKQLQDPYIVDLRLQLHGVIYRPDSFVLMLRYCANLKEIRYESTSLNRIVADKSHRIIAA